MPTTREKSQARQTKAGSSGQRMDDLQKKEMYDRFRSLVNMNAAEIEKWLKTDESGSVGQDSGDGRSIGSKSGSRIIKILTKEQDKLTKTDYDHMQRVISYISRHSAQGPTKSDVEDSNWRYSLMNWGHDPLKK